MPDPKSRRVLRLPQVIEKSGLGRDSIYRLAHEDRFPRPVKLSERASGWFEDEVDAWLERRAAERDAAPVPSAPKRMPKASAKKHQRTAASA